MTARRLALSLAIAATLAVGVLLLIPIPEAALAAASGAPPDSDKAVHVLLFGGLAALWSLAVAVHRVWIWAAVSAYGGLMELLQALTPYRSCEWNDFVADAVGAALVLIAMAVVAAVRARRLLRV